MVAVPISRTIPASVPTPSQAVSADQDEMLHWITAATLVVGGVLLVTGNRKTGLAVAAAGTALALLEEQDSLKEWWDRLPGHLSQAQSFLDNVEHYLGEAAAQGQRLQNMIRR